MKVNIIFELNKIKYFFKFFLFLLIFQIQISEINSQTLHIEKKNEQKNLEKTKLTLAHIISLGPTYSNFVLFLNDDIKNLTKFSDLEISKKFYRINRGFYFTHEFLCAYKTLNWFENQIFININTCFLFSDKFNHFGGSINLDIGSNIAFYQNNFFKLIGVGLKISFPFNYDNQKNLDDKLLSSNILPFLKLGIGYQFDFGLILRVSSNISGYLFTIKENYHNYIKSIDDSNKRSKIITSLCSNILEFSIGYNYAKLFDLQK